MVTAICIIFLIYQFAKSKYIEAHGTAWYRNVYLPRKQLEEQQYKQNK